MRGSQEMLAFAGPCLLTAEGLKFRSPRFAGIFVPAGVAFQQTDFALAH